MGKELSPKRIQRSQGYDDALSYYSREYLNALMNGDGYLSGLLMDEISQTILLMRHNSLSREELHSQIRQVLQSRFEDEQKGNEFTKKIDEDIEVELLKRYKTPKEYEEEERSAQD